MRVRNSLITLAFIVAAPAGWALDAAKERVIELNDGSRVVLRADGSLGHYDAGGVPVAMTEGNVMTARDGTRIMMKGASLWREIVEQATVNFALASAFPLPRDGANQLVVELLGGGRITLRADGTMIHNDAAGNQVRMAEGDVMTAIDGTRILMNNGTLWSPGSHRDAPRSGP